MNIKDVKTYPLGHFGILALSATIGAVSLGGTVLFVSTFPLPDQVMLPAMVLGGLFAFSVSMMPVLFAPAWANARGFAVVTGLGLALAFCGLDAAVQSVAVMSYEKQLKAEAIDLAEARVLSVQGKLDNLPTSQEVCVGHGPLNCGARQEGLAADRLTLDGQLKEAKDELKEVEASALPYWLLSACLLFIQAATFFGRAFLTSVTERQKEAIRTARKPRATSAKTKAKSKAKPKARKVTPPPPAQRELKLVPANDTTH